MPSLANHQSNDFVKLLLLGDAKSGKTGSLVSLVDAGYNLRILDFDNLLDILKYKILEVCPSRLGSVEYRSLRDKTKSSNTGTVIDGKPQAWVNAIKMLDHWKYDDVDFGVPATWGPDCILVIDSLSRLCDAAYDYHESAIPKGNSGHYDGRAVYGNAQDDVERLLGMLTSSHFRTNVIVICHGTYLQLDGGQTKIFPQGVGQKLSPKIPQYFPNYVRYTNKSGKRTIELESSAMIDLANTNPSVLKGTLPIETGLAEIFKVLRSPSAKIEEKVAPYHEPTELAKRGITVTGEPTPRPKTVTLKRV